MVTEHDRELCINGWTDYMISNIVETPVKFRTVYLPYTVLAPQHNTETRWIDHTKYIAQCFVIRNVLLCINKSCTTKCRYKADKQSAFNNEVKQECFLVYNSVSRSIAIRL